jgi:pSer/pThr/pTyr-binding forkhead associated (FHA) protein
VAKNNMKMITVGRSPENDVVITDKTVSGKHLSFTLKDENQYFVQDLGSSNGTFVNGEKLGFAPVEIQSTDIVKIGETILPWTNYFIENQATPPKVEMNPTEEKTVEQLPKKPNRLMLYILCSLGAVCVVLLMVWYFTQVVKP